MSLNSPRPPRPPRPGGRRSGTRPAGPPRGSGLQPGGAASAKSDFGDTRTVILSRKNMGMQQKLKDDSQPKQGSAPSTSAPQLRLPTATVVDGTVSCVKCSSSFPILGDEYYGAVVECPDCEAEFIIPAKAEVAANVVSSTAPTQAPGSPSSTRSTSTPSARKSPTATSASEKKRTTQVPKDKMPKVSSTTRKRRPLSKVPSFVESELEDEEEVYICDSQPASLGGALLAAVFALLTGIAGLVPLFIEGLSPGVAMAIPAGAGILFAILSFIFLKGNDGNKALVVTNVRVFSKAGKWFSSSELD